MRVLQPLLVANCLLFVAACSKPPATETPASRPAAVPPPPTGPAVATRPAVTETPVPKGPPILTLRANGAILDPDGTAFGSRDAVEKFLNEERSRTKAASLPFRAERDTDTAKVRQALLLYKRAGFPSVELCAVDKKSGTVVQFGPCMIDGEEFPIHATVVVNVNGTGSQANQVREILLRTTGGETGLGRSEWRERLSGDLKARMGRDEVLNKDACDIQADGRLSYDSLLEVVELCAKAGVKHIEVAAFAKKPREE